MERPHAECLSRREFFPRAAAGVAIALRSSETAAAEDSPLQRERLQGIERDCLRYFLENQTEQGLFLDRQRNFGERYAPEVVPCSTSATGMGFIALALASESEHRLVDRREARERCLKGTETALKDIPEDHGILPHFLRGSRLEPWGSDTFSTVDSAWLVAGAGTAAEILDDDSLRAKASELYHRVDWRYWTNGNGRLLSHGKNRQGEFLGPWDRFNGETAFLYVLAAGAEDRYAVGADTLDALDPHIGEAEGMSVASADLGLFTHQFGNQLLDLKTWHHAGAIDLHEHARRATRANILSCTRMGNDRATFRTLWGVSAGDGPGEGSSDAYRSYSMREHDGTAHVLSSIAAIEHERDAVFRNIAAADVLGLRGRYAFSNANLDRAWKSQDVVGIDAGNTAMALDNFLNVNRVRKAFHALPQVKRGLQRLGFCLR